MRREWKMIRVKILAIPVSWCGFGRVVEPRKGKYGGESRELESLAYCCPSGKAGIRLLIQSSILPCWVVVLVEGIFRDSLNEYLLESYCAWPLYLIVK